MGLGCCIQLGNDDRTKHAQCDIELIKICEVVCVSVVYHGGSFEFLNLQGR